MDLTVDHAVDDWNAEYRAAAIDTTHGIKHGDCWMNVSPGAWRTQVEYTRECSSGRTLRMDLDQRLSFESVDLEYMEDMVKRLVSENRFRSNDECGTSLEIRLLRTFCA